MSNPTDLVDTAAEPFARFGEDADEWLSEIEYLDRVEADCKARRLRAMRALRDHAETLYRAAHPVPDGVFEPVPAVVTDGVIAEIAAVRCLSRGVVQQEMVEATQIGRLDVVQEWRACQSVCVRGWVTGIG
ncbi:hypothetical protein EG850_12175 [Gulosibacter macacae]|uniref:Uncharacterized protein n=1 Tax=Gulosibacter macacae TaxID=2488791 RepID=A0A3P3VUT4_9MICO|nr:hypothetical protein [Gulosibacter macacae]RRJ85738.1 hypothetical protein EG850_12175 [Gulosibacter macacae]